MRSPGGRDAVLRPHSSGVLGMWGSRTEAIVSLSLPGTHFPALTGWLCDGNLRGRYWRFDRDNRAAPSFVLGHITRSGR